jgi:DnaK suppressor protein
VLPGDDPWTSEELAEIRGELEEQVRDLRAEIADAEAAIAELQRDRGGDGAGDDQADAGAKTFEREHEMSLANNSRDLLAQVQRALARLEVGTYGVCESCGNPIGKDRLLAAPRATLCMACKQREERR